LRHRIQNSIADRSKRTITDAMINIRDATEADLPAIIDIYN
jgi:hypothetical protein